MKNLNQVTIIGNVTRDAELTNTTNSCVARFTVANNRDYGENKVVNFFDCEAWGAFAEKIITPYCKKGVKVMVVGELRQDSYTDKNGNAVTKYKIIVNDIELLSKPTATTAEPVQSTNNSYTDYPEF